jgi:hypothetical protein
MRFPSLSEISKLALLFVFVSDKIFVEANHRSRTAPGAEDPDFGRGLFIDHETHDVPQHVEYEYEPAALRFSVEDSKIHDHDKEDGNRRLLRAKHRS